MQPILTPLVSWDLGGPVRSSSPFEFQAVLAEIKDGHHSYILYHLPFHIHLWGQAEKRKRGDNYYSTNHIYLGDKRRRENASNASPSGYDASVSLQVNLPKHSRLGVQSQQSKLG